MKPLVDFLSGHIGRTAAVLVILILVTAYFRRASDDNNTLKGRKRLIVDSVLTLLIAGWALTIAIVVIYGFSGGSPVTEQPVVHSPYCFVYAFPEPSFPDRAPDLLKELKLPDEPPGCLRDIASHISEATHVTLLGRTDRRELSPEASRQYRSNEVLALQRAKDMQAWLSPREGALLLTTGPRYLGSKIDTKLLARDRSVEIGVYWKNSSPDVPELRPKAGAPLNTSSMEADVSMALLALMVALSAYLVTVGLFLADRAEKLENRSSTDLKAKKIRMQRRLLILADTPTVVAAFLLSLHIFSFYPSVTLVPASILLFRMAVVTLILFHMSQWILALPKKKQDPPPDAGSALNL